MRTKEGRSQPKNNEFGKNFLDRWAYTLTFRAMRARHVLRKTHLGDRNDFFPGHALHIKPRNVMIGMFHAEGFEDIAILTR